MHVLDALYMSTVARSVRTRIFGAVGGAGSNCTLLGGSGENGLPFVLQRPELPCGSSKRDCLYAVPAAGAVYAALGSMHTVKLLFAAPHHGSSRPMVA